MINDEVQVFLEHFGVKGQKWGVRRRQGQQQHLDRLHRVARGTATRNDKAAIRARRIGVGSLAVGGTIAIAILSRSGTMSISKANKMANRKSVDAILEARKSIKMHEISKGQLITANRIRDFVKTLQ